MKFFDDPLPEEQETRYRELIELVQQARRSPVYDTAAEQDQAIARVRQRLAALEYTAHQSESNESQLEEKDLQFGENELKQVGTTMSLPAGSASVSGAILYRRWRSVHILNALAAVLVVGLLIGTSFVLFRRSPQSTTTAVQSTITTGPAIGPVGTPVTVHVASSGLDMSMSVTPGPYFLSELIAVDMSLTNHTHTAYQLTGGQDPTSECSPVLHATLAGGGSPHFSMFKKSLTYYLACVLVEGQIPLNPGQTITDRQYIPLISSGENTLTAQLSYPISFSPTVFDPFKGHVLSTKLNVMTRVPTDRRILSLQPHGSAVLVIVPSSVHPQLADFSLTICQDSQGKQQEAGTFSWISLTTHTLVEPDCPGNNVQWIYAVGAAGYAIVAGDSSP